MKIELRPLANITPYEKNPRLNDAAIDAVANLTCPQKLCQILWL